MNAFDMPRLKYHIIAFLVVVVWGSTFVSTKILLMAGLSPAQIFTLRFVIAYLLLLPFSIKRQTRWFAANVRDELMMVALGITGGSLYFLTENAAMNYTTTTNTSLIVCLCPLFATLLIACFYRSERLSRLRMFGTILAAAGVVIVVLNGHFVLHLSPLGDALAFTACLCWAVYSLLMIPASSRYSSLFITRKLFAYGLITMIPYFMVYPEMPSVSVFTDVKVLVNIFYLGCIASTLCFLLWNWVIPRLGAVVTTNYVYFNPVVTIICAWLILSETITMWLLLGTAMILSGMYLADRKRKNQNRVGGKH